MRAVMLEVPEHLLEERRRLGHDVWDEMWEGVLHMVPPPSGWHQVLAHRLGLALDAAAKARGLVGSHETGVFRPGTEPPEWDYRIPDLVYSRREHRSERGVEGVAELAIEVRSPGDESYDKVPFYAEVGCREVLIVDQNTLAMDLFVRGERQPEAREYRLESLGVTVATLDGPALRITWEGIETVITPL